MFAIVNAMVRQFAAVSCVQVVVYMESLLQVMKVRRKEDANGRVEWHKLREKRGWDRSGGRPFKHSARHSQHGRLQCGQR